MLFAPSSRNGSSIALVLCALAIFMLIGCMHVETTTRADLEARARRQVMNSYGLSYHYCGSKNGYDYFCGFDPNAGSLGRERWFRVSESQQTISDRFPFTKKRNQWRPLLSLPLK